MNWKTLNAPCKKGIYLSVFRIYLCFHLLKKIFFVWPSSDFLYGNDGFIFRPASIEILSIDASYFTNNIHFFLSTILFLIVLFAFGIGRSITTVLLFLSWYILQQLNIYILNGGDNYLIIILLYMCFTNSFTHLTLSNSRGFLENSITNFLSNLAVYSIIIHLCLIYFISGISKIHSDLWYNGVAVYYIMNIERFQGTDYNVIIAKNGFLVTITTYGTMFWEAFFTLLVSLQSMRVPTLIIGVLLHLSIYVFMMIHDFEILYVMIYGFFFTDEDFRKWRRYITNKARYGQALIREKLSIKKQLVNFDNADNA